MFCITDISEVTAGPVGLISPLVQLIYNASAGDRSTTIGMTIFFPIISMAASGPGVVSATSRVIWSFAREEGLPKFLASIDKRQKVPINAIIATWLCVSLISLIYIGNATAFYGLASGCTVVFIVSYAMPITVRLIWEDEFQKLKRGPFSLGRYSRAVGYVAVAWWMYLTIFLCFPVYLPVTKVNMNYSCLVLGFGIIAPTVAWFAYGKHRYLGAVREVDSAVVEIVAEHKE